MRRAFPPPRPCPSTCAPGKKHVCQPQARRLSPLNACKALCRSRQCRCPTTQPTPPNRASAARRATVLDKNSPSFRMWNLKPRRFPHQDVSSGRANGGSAQCCPRRQSQSAVYDCFCALALCDDRCGQVDLLWCELTLTASSDRAFNAFGRAHHSVCAEASCRGLPALPKGTNDLLDARTETPQVMRLFSQHENLSHHRIKSHARQRDSSARFGQEKRWRGPAH